MDRVRSVFPNKFSFADTDFQRLDLIDSHSCSFELPNQPWLIHCWPIVAPTSSLLKRAAPLEKKHVAAKEKQRSCQPGEPGRG
jgi:hypothetical protein